MVPMVPGFEHRGCQFELVFLDKTKSCQLRILKSNSSMGGQVLILEDLKEQWFQWFQVLSIGGVNLS